MSLMLPAISGDSPRATPDILEDWLPH